MLSQNLGHVSIPLGLFPTYCFPPEKPMLRFGTFSGGIQVVFNKLVLFQEKYLAKEIAISDRGLPLANITVDDLHILPSVNDTDFQPAVGALKRSTNPVDVPSGLMDGTAIRKVSPVYPPAAKLGHIGGRVVMDALIGRDGRIHRLNIASSPDPNLSIAAIQAAQQWSYKPYTQAGEPVEVKTQIIINFQRS